MSDTDNLEALRERVTQQHQTIMECNAKFNRDEDTIKALTARVQKLEVDSARLDWLENEIVREMEGYRYGKSRSLFRLNEPITRETIDAAMERG